MQHTPGPWRWEDWTGAKATTDVVIGPEKMGRGQRPVARLIGHSARVRKGERRPPATITDLDRANARLIAAAPDLLAELQHVVSGVESHMSLPDERRTKQDAEAVLSSLAISARAATTKATTP